MKAKHMEALRELRDEGYAVIVWNPDELRGASPGDVEDRSVEFGNDVIDCLATEPETED